MRGNLTSPGSAHGASRSIPACAGEPDTHKYGDCGSGVYPRVCGGTHVAHAVLHAQPGLSPRVRGNLHVDTATNMKLRSIPACAGEPGAAAVGLEGGPVYPACAGEPASLRQSTPPRGSIPACAGEPPTCRRKARSRRVYPRVCGGTTVRPGALRRWRGLSPRVRGNRDKISGTSAAARSIPACAGEPPCSVRRAG